MLPEDEAEVRSLFQEVGDFWKRDILGIAPQPTPEGLFPHPARSTPAVNPRVTPAPAEPRRPPVATGEVPSGVTVIRPIEPHSENSPSASADQGLKE